jgi:hypothetical protein
LGIRQVACLRAAGPRVVAGLPSLCYAFRQEFERFADCLFAGWIDTIIEVPSGEVVGTVTGATILWNSLAYNQRSWTEHIRVEVVAVTGEGSATTFTAPIVCSPRSTGCRDTGRGIWAGQGGFLEAREGAIYSGERDFDSPGTATDEMAIQVDMLFDNPVANPAPLTIGPTEKMRCDSELIFKPTKGGCVYKNATENIMEILRSENTVTEAALFIKTAQKKIHNHAGWFGHGIALTRLTNKSTIRRNRRVACKDVHPGEGQSCDEYPFASTNQGASLVPPTDFRSKAVNAEQNSRVGSVYLSYFLLHERIAAGDSYYVQII